MRDWPQIARWSRVMGLMAWFGLAAPAHSADASWVNLCTAHGSVWQLVGGADSKVPNRDQAQGGCHSACTLARKTRILR
jgi:hypothetical protein